MSNNNRNQVRTPANETAIGAAIVAAGAIPDGPANAAEIIADMVEGQKEVLAAKQVERELYGPVECSSADGNVTDRFGRKSCAAIAVQVPIPSLGLKLDATLWGRLIMDATGTTIIFEAGMPKGLKAMDEHGKDRLLAHIETGAQAWPGYDKTTDAVAAKLTGQNAKPGTVGGRPKLVKRVQLSQQAPTTGA